MDKIKKPLPKIDRDSKKFWEGCKDEKLLFQYCEDCDKFIYYPRIICPYCMGEDLSWEESSGKGKVYSYTVVRYGPPGYGEDVPYIAALIEMEEGVRMISNVIDCNPDNIHCDMAVKVVFKQRDTFKIPLFKPI